MRERGGKGGEERGDMRGEGRVDSGNREQGCVGGGWGERSGDRG